MKIYFGKIVLNFPNDVDVSNYQDLIKSFESLSGQPYSIKNVEKILNEIDTITVNHEFKSIKSSVEEKLVTNILNLNFTIEDTEKTFVQQINILGNNITEESVIRNQLILDEGDPYNEILLKNQKITLKVKFFKNVKTSVLKVRIQIIK